MQVWPRVPSWPLNLSLKAHLSIDILSMSNFNNVSHACLIIH
jgi:hypothetical protein